MGINGRPEYELTLDEYLAIEEYANIKHEYLDGVVYAMAGGVGVHNIIAARLIRLTGLHGRKVYEAFTSDQKVYVEQVRASYYPDVSIVCGNPRYHDNRTLLLVNPVAIFEVTSPSTAKLDRGSKVLGKSAIKEKTIVRLPLDSKESNCGGNLRSASSIGKFFLLGRS